MRDQKNEGTEREARVRILWGNTCLLDRWVEPGSSFVVGEGPSSFALPRELVGAERVVLVGATRSSIEVGICPNATLAEPTAVVPLPRISLLGDDEIVQRLGNITLVVSAERRATRIGKRWRLPGRAGGFWLGSAGLAAVVLFSLARVEPPPEEERLQARIELMRRYLQATIEPDESLEEVEPGTGTRARGDEGSMGNPNRSATNRRYAVQGPRDNPDPHQARGAALQEAAEFGMIGLLSTAAAGDPLAPVDPTGRDDTLGRDPQSRHVSRGSGRQAKLARSSDDLGSPDRIGPWPTGEDTGTGFHPMQDPKVDRWSTFAIDVDTGSYTMAKRSLNADRLPAARTVRTEEFLNYFDYEYPEPDTARPEPFRVHLEAAPSPYDAGHHLLRVAVQGRRVAARARPPMHLVYLVDVSGSMHFSDKLELAKDSLRFLTASLRAGDTVALCTYAGNVREVLPPTGAWHRERILQAIDDLRASGATAMGSGLELAYRLAARTLVPGHINRVIVLSDGDANVGRTSADDILATIEGQRRLGIQLSTVGFGGGNYRDATMERLADAGDGNYSYVGDLRDARRVFTERVDSLVYTIARDVKVQVEFDPARVVGYRLLGYENRDVRDEDFRDDRVDGGEIGAGHSVTALYDVVLREHSASPATVRLRYKAAQGERAFETVASLPPEAIQPSFAMASDSLRWAAAVAGLAEKLRGSPSATHWDLHEVHRLAETATHGEAEREELLGLIDVAIRLGATS